MTLVLLDTNAYLRLVKRVRLSQAEKAQIHAMTSVLRAHVLENTSHYTRLGRSPPSPTDCFCMAFGQVRPAVVATDDLGMHKLADDFELPVFHCHDVLKKMLTAKVIDKSMVIEIYHALEINRVVLPSLPSKILPLAPRYDSCTSLTGALLRTKVERKTGRAEKGLRPHASPPKTTSPAAKRAFRRKPQRVKCKGFQQTNVSN